MFLVYKILALMFQDKDIFCGVNLYGNKCPGLNAFIYSSIKPLGSLMPTPNQLYNDMNE